MDGGSYFVGKGRVLVACQESTHDPFAQSPKRTECVGATQSHRTLMIGEHHSFLQARRREMQSAAFQEEMHRRNGIEGSQSELVRAYGLRHARYRGFIKVRLQNYLIGAACNLRRLCRRLAWKAVRSHQTSLAPVAAPTV